MSHIGTRLEPEPGDLAPSVGAQTDVAPLGRDVQKPAHELTHVEDVDVVDWDEIAATNDFKNLVAARIGFIVPATIFFLIYYLALPLLAGFAKDFMNTKVIGDVNVAYLFALSQFVMTFVIAGIYLRKAAVFDAMAHNIAKRVKGTKGGQ